MPVRTRGIGTGLTPPTEVLAQAYPGSFYREAGMQLQGSNSQLPAGPFQLGVPGGPNPASPSRESAQFPLSFTVHTVGPLLETALLSTFNQRPSTASPHLTSSIGSAPLSETMCKGINLKKQGKFLQHLSASHLRYYEMTLNQRMLCKHLRYSFSVLEEASIPPPKSPLSVVKGGILKAQDCRREFKSWLSQVTLSLSPSLQNEDDGNSTL